MAKIHVLFARKGGVGKSLICLNMAAVCADVRGARPDGRPRVAVASADPQGTALWRAARLSEMPFDILDISAEAELIPRLRELPYDHVFVDTPGWTPPSLEQFEDGANPLGEADDVAQLLDSILEQAHDAIVPILTEPDSFDPTYQTVEWVLKPRGITYQVVINNWPPSEGIAYVDGTRKLCERHGWPVANTVIRRYRVHTNATKVVTQYNNNRVELQAREDFYRFALEHGLSGAGDRLEQIAREEVPAS